jgi:NADH-quinone oxidoreductase subunit A
MICLSFFFVLFKKDINKNKAYECGFQNFGIIYNQYEIHYYKIAILFLIFDIEIIFLIPCNLNFFLLTPTGLITFFIFLFFLFYTLILEYYSNVLNWYL